MMNHTHRLPPLDIPFQQQAKDKHFFKMQQQNQIQTLPTVTTPPLTPPHTTFHSCSDLTRKTPPPTPQLSWSSNEQPPPRDKQRYHSRRGSGPAKLLFKNSNGVIVNLLNENDAVEARDKMDQFESPCSAGYSSTSTTTTASPSSSSLCSDDDFATSYFGRKPSVSSSCYWSEDGGSGIADDGYRKFQYPSSSNAFVDQVQQIQEQFLPLRLNDQRISQRQSITPTTTNSNTTTLNTPETSPTTTTPNTNSSNANSTNPTLNKRKYVCMHEGCGKGFTTSGHLARHNRIHTGEKNFNCLLRGCTSKFSRQDNMMQHYRTHTSSKSRRGSKVGQGAKNSILVGGLNMDASKLIDVNNNNNSSNNLPTNHHPTLRLDVEHHHHHHYSNSSQIFIQHEGYRNRPLHQNSIPSSLPPPPVYTTTHNNNSDPLLMSRYNSTGSYLPPISDFNRRWWQQQLNK